MNLRDLHYFIKLAELKHFGKTAEACFVSQPTLSMQIKKLEDELGVALFERQKKQVILTDAAKTLLPFAENMLSNLDLMKKSAQSLKDPLSGSITLSAIESLAPYLLPHLMPQLSKKFPDIKWRLQEGKTDQLLEQLHKGQIDIALLALPIPDQQLKTIPLFKEEFYVAIGSEHRFYKLKQPLSLAKLTKEPLLLLEEGHCLRDQALELCHIPQNEQNDYRAASLETLRYTVAHHNQLTIMPLLACMSTQGLMYLPIKDNKATRDIALVYRQSTTNEALIKQIAQAIQIIITPRLDKLSKHLKA